MDRVTLKARGKAAFEANYWKTVLVALLLFVAVGGLFVAGSANSTSNYDFFDEEDDYYGYMECKGASDSSEQLLLDTDAPRATHTVRRLDNQRVKELTLLGVLLQIFLFGPLEVGCRTFMKKNLREPADLDLLNVAFTPHYWSNVATMLLQRIFIFLWSLLFLIPGIVMSYAYAMTPYLRNDFPELSPKDTITWSRTMMDGHKWELFVFDLSFLGWGLLSVLTANLLGVFYVFPYMYSAHAAFYEELKAQTVFPGTPANGAPAGNGGSPNGPAPMNGPANGGNQNGSAAATPNGTATFDYSYGTDHETVPSNAPSAAPNAPASVDSQTPAQTATPAPAPIVTPPPAPAPALAPAPAAPADSAAPEAETPAQNPEPVAKEPVAPATEEAPAVATVTEDDNSATVTVPAGKTVKIVVKAVPDKPADADPNA